jgi:hypothetical protein
MIVSARVASKPSQFKESSSQTGGFHLRNFEDICLQGASFLSAIPSNCKKSEPVIRLVPSAIKDDSSVTVDCFVTDASSSCKAASSIPASDDFGTIGKPIESDLTKSNNLVDCVFTKSTKQVQSNLWQVIGHDQDSGIIFYAEKPAENVATSSDSSKKKLKKKRKIDDSSNEDDFYTVVLEGVDLSSINSDDLSLFVVLLPNSLKETIDRAVREVKSRIRTYWKSVPFYCFDKNVLHDSPRLSFGVEKRCSGRKNKAIDLIESMPYIEDFNCSVSRNIPKIQWQKILLNIR